MRMCWHRPFFIIPDFFKKKIITNLIDEFGFEMVVVLLDLICHIRAGEDNEIIYNEELILDIDNDLGIYDVEKTKSLIGLIIKDESIIDTDRFKRAGRLRLANDEFVKEAI